MSRKVLLRLAPVLAVLALVGTAARADYYYNFDPLDTVIKSDSGKMMINLENQPQVGPIASGVDTNIVATTLTTSILPNVSGTDTFSTGQKTKLRLTITDGTKSESWEFGIRFSGSLNSTFSKIGVAFEGPSSKTLFVNGSQYDITLDSIVPPGVPNAIKGSVGGRIVAGIKVNPPPNPGGNTPEPSSMVLAGLGATMVGIAGWKRRRAARLAAAASVAV